MGCRFCKILDELLEGENTKKKKSKAVTSSAISVIEGRRGMVWSILSGSRRWLTGNDNDDNDG